MNSEKAKIIANWRPENSREADAMKQFLLQEMGVTIEHHQGGTGKQGMHTGRKFR
ncbi:hypothetical protein [Thaumasiovibrio sp. DFM-14]|uniref:hypothetical protein n=1 Tax=Thaumasiovibrio sp. DFM-14 TaxID=3384792 RepID=UPI0039A0485B